MKKQIVGLFLLLLTSGCGSDDTVIQGLLDLSGAELAYKDGPLKLTVAAVCLEHSTNKQENLSRLILRISELSAARPDLRLIVFGETALGWYCGPGDRKQYAIQTAEPVPGPAVNAVAAAASSNNTFVIFGLVETNAADATLYNTQVAVSPDGTIAAIHRKIRLTPEDESCGFSPGPKTAANAPVFSIDGIRTGMIICADVQSLWLTRRLTEARIRLLAHSMAYDGPPFRIDPVARQFNSWVVFANRCGNEGDLSYDGTLYISDPSGTMRTGDRGGSRTHLYQIGVWP